MTPSRKYVFTSRLRRFPRAGKAGFTLVELLMATTLSLMLLMGVVTVFASISAGVSDARALLETADRLRATKNVLQQDLAGVTATMLPPRRPEANEGYFELIEGPLGVLRPVWDASNFAGSFAMNTQMGEPDTTVADVDDILMFTTRREDRPFVGKFPGGSLQSHVAEVAWFVRGHTLYRRVLLVAPQMLSVADATDATPGNGRIDDTINDNWSYYRDYDVSARPVFGPNLLGWIPNTLGDLTKRENRFAHWLHGAQAFPFDASAFGLLGLPLLQECSHPNWMTWNNPAAIPVGPHASNSTLQVDLWNAPHDWSTATPPPPPPSLNPITGVLTAFQGPRAGEDVILTNVIGFDVKVWDPQAPIVSDGNVMLQPGDPGYITALINAMSASPTYTIATRGAYVDLNYVGNQPTLFGLSHFSAPPDIGATGSAGPTRIYDTWSFHYEYDGIDQFGDGTTDLGTNGMDDNNDGVVDDSLEMDTRPPYRAPLRGIQVKIRIFEPDTKQVREVTVVQDFLPK